MAYIIPADFVTGGTINAEDHNNIKNSIDGLKGGVAGDAPTRTVEDLNTLVDTYSNHSNLSNLDQDTHTQYSPVAGTRPFTGIASYNNNKVFTADTEIIAKKYVDDLLTLYSLVAGTRPFSGIVSYDNDKVFTADTELIAKKYVDDLLITVYSDMNAAILAALPAGVILPYGNASTPTNYFLCDGSAVSKTTYSTLFSAIGTTWGDSGANFLLPDGEGAIFRGAGSHGTYTMADGNPFAGPSVGAFENDQMQGHQVRISRYDSDTYLSGGSVQSGTGTTVAIQNTGVAPTSGNVYVGKTLIADGTNGTPRSGDETRPFAAGVRFIIKYQ